MTCSFDKKSGMYCTVQYLVGGGSEAEMSYLSVYNPSLESPFLYTFCSLLC